MGIYHLPKYLFTCIQNEKGYSTYLNCESQKLDFFYADFICYMPPIHIEYQYVLVYIPDVI